MPYDYPGYYAGRFDGIDLARSFFFKRIAGQLQRSLLPLPPGTLVLEGIVAATPYGSVLLDQWLRAPPASAARNIVIETLDYGGVAIGRWTLTDAFPEKAPIRSLNDKLLVSVVSLELTHRGLFRS